MPTGNLRDHAVTLEVPPDLAELFREQAHQTLHDAADSLEQTLRWHEEGRRNASPEQIAHSREAVRMASDLLEQTYAAGTTVKVTADRATIASTLQGCLLDVSDDVKAECEHTADADRRAMVRTRISSVETVLSLMDAAEGQGR